MREPGVIVPRERRQVLHPTGGESRTKQADKDAANINTIVKQWLRTGIPPQGSKIPRYGNFENADDYLTCMLKVREANEEFMKLSAEVRKRCDNDPGKFLDLVSDPERREELVELGLVDEQVPPQASDAVSAEVGSEEPEVPAEDTIPT